MNYSFWAEKHVRRMQSLNKPKTQYLMIIGAILRLRARHVLPCTHVQSETSIISSICLPIAQSFSVPNQFDLKNRSPDCAMQQDRARVSIYLNSTVLKVRHHEIDLDGTLYTLLSSRDCKSTYCPRVFNNCQ